MMMVLLCCSLLIPPIMLVAGVAAAQASARAHQQRHGLSHSALHGWHEKLALRPGGLRQAMAAAHLLP